VSKDTTVHRPKKRVEQSYMEDLMGEEILNQRKHLPAFLGGVAWRRSRSNDERETPCFCRPCQDIDATP